MEKEDEETTPDWLVFLMGKCWVNIPSERPTFPEILSFIEDEMRKMELEQLEVQGNGSGSIAPRRKLSREEMEADWSKRLGIIPRNEGKDGDNDD